MADDILLKLTDVPGESKKTGHENEIDVMSVSWSASNSTQSAYGGGGGGSGNVNFTDVSITKMTDASSHLLQLRCFNGKPMDEAKLTFRKQGGEQEEYLIATLTNVYVSSYSISHGGGGDPMESVSLSFDKYKFAYKQQQDDGTLSGEKTAEWDVKAAS